MPETIAMSRSPNGPRRPGKIPRPTARLPRVEVLEGRLMLATFVVRNTNDAGVDSLRQAILDANAAMGADTIAFAIGTGPQTISPASALPDITDAVTVNGTTQPGFAGTPIITLDGSGAVAGSNGLRITAASGGVIIRGLAIQRFSGEGLLLTGTGNNQIAGNLIGTDAVGTPGRGNAGDGIGLDVGVANNTIGGTTAADRNVVSGNGGSGILLNGATGSLIQGNYLGTNAAGGSAVGNAIDGVRIQGGGGHTIGGTTPGARNLISANKNGVQIGGSGGNVVSGNLIGTGISGTLPIGNAGDGVALFASNGNTIGGVSAVHSNTIAFNGGRGVGFQGGTSNYILSNDIFANAGLGIDLGNDGVTPNDTDDTDAGTNNLQNFPVLASADVTTPGNITISGTLNSTISTDFTIQFFASAAADPSGFGEGQQFLGQTAVVTEGTTVVNFSTTLPIPSSLVGRFITATATDSADNTSEFSAALAIPFAVTNTADSGPGSLRQAILNANDVQGLDTITFAIPGTGPFTIAPDSNLPTITSPVVIDGTTQPGARPNTLAGGDNAVLLVALDGGGEVLTNGLTITAGGSTVRGLVIERVVASAIALSGGGGNRIIGNFLGTDPAGTADLGNGAGVRISDATANTVGGTAPSDRNIISGNSGSGVDITGSGAIGNLVQGNFIGTDAAGTSLVPNLGDGVAISSFASSNTIGGAVPGSGNVISGQLLGAGVSIDASGGFAGTLVQGNLIGTDVTGTVPLGNTTGVRISASGNTIGGTVPGAGNVIAFNVPTFTGVSVRAGTGNAILSNSIFSNGGLGIDLASDSVTPNDAGDTDSGPNNLQNFPVLTSATIASGNTLLQGTLNSAPGTDFLIQFFADVAADPSGFGEGRTFLGATTVTTGPGGNAPIGFSAPGAILGRVFTATATRLSTGDTSEFGAALEPLSFVVTGTADAIANDFVTTLREAITLANALGGVDTITFAIPGAGPFTISPTAALPTITDAVIIDGTTQPGFAGTPIIELAGTNAGATADGLTILGGGSTVQGLVINRFRGNGIVLSGGGGDIVRGNYIGTDVSGTAALGNAAGGILVNAPGNTVGGTASGAGNLISGNGGYGVAVGGGTGNAIRSNAIFANGGLGIALNIDGVTPNDPADGDTGANNLQNFPVLSSATSGGGATTIIGSLHSTPNTTFQIEFFADAGDPSGSGEGQTFLGTTAATTDGAGDAIVSGAFPLTVSPGQVVTATATDPAGNTSEFSRVSVTLAGISFTVVNTADAGPGSLRQAILNANAVAGLDTIDFAIPGTGPFTIKPASALPTINGSVVIDGYTQPGSSPNTNGPSLGDNAVILVTIDGGALPPQTDGLVLAASASSIRGLAIGGFSAVGGGAPIQAAIRVPGSGNVIAGNFLGTNAAGTAAAANHMGVTVQGPNNTIGGTAPADRNVVAGNTQAGIILTDSGNNTLIQGNLIGTGSDGTTAIPNTTGIDSGDILGPTTGTTIGGRTAAARNVIANSVQYGVSFRNAAPNVALIEGNFIGLDVTGGAAGNGIAGIAAAAVTSLTVGGTAAGAGNTIAFNLRGISGSRSAFTILSNSIYSNRQLGIDLLNGGMPSPNQPGPGDVSNNVPINYPVLNSVVTAGGVTTVTGVYNGAANEVILLQFFADDGDASGYAEGRFLIGQATVTTDATGNAPIAFTFTGTLPGAGISATATDSRGFTSEFSLNTVVFNEDDSLLGSLRQAIANTFFIRNTPSTISFQIPGGGVHTIRPTTGLPAVRQAVVIDGTTQPGSRPNTLATGANDAVILIELDGSLTSNQVGIEIQQTGAATVSGLAINRFAVQINVGFSNNVVIAGNFLGTDPTGATGLGGVRGISAQRSFVTIGGTTPAARNVISGSSQEGIVLGGVGPTVLIQGNIIGLDATATRSLFPNNGLASPGIDTGSTLGTTIGGTAPGSGNIIAGNGGTGITVPFLGSAGQALIQGNFIGTNPAGDALGNGGSGILIDTSNSTIGGSAVGAGNTIAFNGAGDRIGGGVVVRDLFVGSGTGNAILGNAIFSNTSNGSVPNRGLGIDLAGDGPTPNDAGDADTGVNNLQNFPILTSATSNGGITTIGGVLNSNPNTAFRLEFFADAGDPSGFGEGQTFLGATTVTTNPSGFVVFSALIPAGVTPGQVATATATDPAGNTSEFSQVFAVVVTTNFTVFNTNDSGFGSLRQAILNANATPGFQTIDFAIPGSGVQTIAPTSELPTITEAVTIDATSQPGFAGTPVIELAGTNAGTTAAGLTIIAGGSTVRGLVIDRFRGNGIVLSGGGGNTVLGNYIGTNATGVAALGNGDPVQVSGTGLLVTNSPGNTIGGATSSDRNVISGNITNVVFSGNTTANNVVLGNYVGTDATGTLALGVGNGIVIGDDGFTPNSGARDNVIQGNLISGNSASDFGVIIQSPSATGNVVRGNLIGTNAAGTAAVGNGYGVGIGKGASANTIGGMTAADRNVISGNINAGVFLDGAIGNTIVGNDIGTDPAGIAALDPTTTTSAGVFLDNGSLANTIGGAAPGAGNVISGNAGLGVLIQGRSVGSGTLSNGNLVQGNFIGTGAGGISNGSHGVQISSGGFNNTIGGTAAAAGNTIAFNRGDGVFLKSDAGTGNAILTNAIFANAALGIDLQGPADVPSGVTGNDPGDVDAGPNNLQNFPILSSVRTGGGTTRINGTLAGAPGTYTVQFFASAAVDPSGFGEGQQFLGQAIVVLGGIGTAGFSGSLATGPLVGHFITATATDSAGNTSEFSNAVVASLVVTSTADAGPGSLREALLTANALAGPDTIVFAIPGVGPFTIRPSSALPAITEAATIDATTQPGFAGTPIVELDGEDAPPQTTGLTILSGGSTVRGLVINRFNGTGIELGGSPGSLIVGNYIGTDLSGTVGLGNASDGIFLGDSAGNTIGGTTAAARNVISGNGGNGLAIVGSGAMNNLVQGNFIGVNVTGAGPLGNGGNGVFVDDLVTTNNTIGGITPGAGNTIAFNGGNGVVVLSGTAKSILSNAIFGNGGLGIDLGGDGVTPNDAGDTVFGPNFLQNFPVLTGVTIGGGTTTLTGTLNSTPGDLFLIQFFASAAADPSRFGEGQTFLGAMTVATDDLGNASFSFPVSGAILGQIFTATATSVSTLSTSEFGPALEGPSLVVTSTGDVIANDFVTTLREAITFANSNPGVDTITFNIPGPGVRTITPTSALPAITEAAVIDGYTQPGARPNALAGGDDAVLLIALTGIDPGSGASGLRIAAGGSTVRGLVINGFRGPAIDLVTGGNAIAGNFLGTDPSGRVGLGNGTGVMISGAANTIGGTAPADRNIISGNRGIGVLIIGSGAAGNLVASNFIGTTRGGDVPLGNASSGVEIASGANGNLIGSTTSAAGRNVIAANAPGTGSDAFLANVLIRGVGTDDNVVAGNFIGTDATGSFGLSPAQVRGVQVRDGAARTIVGGAGVARNVVSGHNHVGIELVNGVSGTAVRGNYVGSDAGGNAGRPDLQNGTDVSLFARLAGPDNNTIGGVAPGEGNVLVNSGFGITFVSPTGQVITGNLIAGNLIGVGADGTSTVGLGLTQGGIILSGVANGTTIGGTAAGAGNVITNTGGPGVAITAAASVNNAILGNSIHGNGGLGIDLGGDGVTPNDPGDLDAGPNNLQNFPILAAATSVAGSTTINGTINSTPGTTFRLEFFADAGDPSGFGEGRTFLGTTLVTTDPTGNVGFSAGLPVGVPPGQFVTATATDPAGNTSEFSLGILAGLSFTVVNTNDSGFGSLRQAILNANAVAGVQTIDFAIPGTSPFTIAPTSALPDVTDPVIIDAYTQKGARPNTLDAGDNAVLLVELSGFNLPAGVSGLTITVGGSTVQGLVINRFLGNGIVLAAVGGNTVRGNFIGTGVTGTTDLGNRSDGVVVISAGNTVGGMTPADRNVISGNDGSGVRIDAGATGILVVGNFIGTDANGTADVGNGFDGVVINAAGNTVGGTAIGARNIISGNDRYGIFLSSPGAAGNVVAGNFIGTDVAGTADLGNGASGVFILAGPGNTVGGTMPRAGNVISGNDGEGVAISGSTAAGNLVAGNLIGTNVNGTAGLGNRSNGVEIDGAAGNTVGGIVAGARNVVSGNSGSGVFINNFAAGNVVAGNFIGTDINGTAGLGNGVGIRLFASSGNTVGGTAAGARNVISGNGGTGIGITGLISAATGNVVAGNLIGTDVTGSADLGNGSNGVEIDGASGNTVGGTVAGARNVISGNDRAGIAITGFTFGGPGDLSVAAGNVVAGNFIGTDVTGTVALGNGRDGIMFEGDARGNTIGGAAANVISGNARGGISLTGSGVVGNLIRGNRIGTNAEGTAAIGNALDGVLLDGAPGNILSGNTIAGNGGNGIRIVGASATGNQVVGNSIGSDNPAGPLANALDGLFIDGAPGNIVAGNTIAGNSRNGLQIATSTATQVQGNVLGLNGDNGVLINAAPGNTIGGVSPGTGNVIIGNRANGIALVGAASGGNVVAGNFVGTNSVGAAALGNAFNGILVADAPNNLIGGVANVISGNGTGISIVGAGASGNWVLSNLIGTSPGGDAPLGNRLDGIVIDGASGNTIGGTQPGQGNILSANGAHGLLIVHAGASGTRVMGNAIGTNLSGTAALGNVLDGIFIADAPANTIGGAAPGAGNLVSGNGRDGVRIEGTGASGLLVQGNRIGTDSAGVFPLGNGGDLATFDAGVRLGFGVTASVVVGNLIAGNVDAGILLEGASSHTIVANLIGTNLSGAANLGNGVGLALQADSHDNLVQNNTIAGNRGPGISLAGAGTTRNRIQGNQIGLPGPVPSPLGNGGDGVLLIGAPGNTIGGTAFGEGNAIVFNGGHGVAVFSGAGNLIADNVISSSSLFGVLLQNAPGNTIGGSSPTALNIIAGNGRAGLFLFGPGTTANVVAGSVIQGNAEEGVRIEDAPGNTIGGADPGVGNVLSGNLIGVQITGAGASGNVVAGNAIGTDPAGVSALGNRADGVFVAGAPNNTIGGTTPGARNVISGNGSVGVQVFGAGASGNVIVGNSIGTDVTGSRDLGNTRNGVFLNDAPGNSVRDNVISGNDLVGVQLSGQAATGNALLRNRIGTDASGTVAVPNGSTGVFLDNAPGNTIGGTSPEARNVIAGNSLVNVYLIGPGATGNLIVGNYLGIDATGTLALGGNYGVFINGAGNNTIGVGNVISGNAVGVEIFGPEARGNQVVGNLIGTGPGGATPLGNSLDGIFLFNVPGTVIAGNVISGNASSGIQIFGPSSVENRVVGNVIGTDVTGTAPLGNGRAGVFVNGASRNVIGGPEPGARNIISANGGSGVQLFGTEATGNVVQGNFIGPDATGTRTLGNAIGLFIEAAPGNVIGGPGPGQNNLITGNTTADLLVINPAAGPGVVTSRLNVADGLVRGLVLTFTTEMDTRRVQDRRNYRVVSAGRDRRFGTRDDARIGIGAASYDPVLRTVTLTLARPLTANDVFQLTVSSVPPRRGLADTSGRALDGNGDGRPGGNYSARFDLSQQAGLTTGRGRTPRRAVRTVTVRRAVVPRLSASAVDSLLVQGALDAGGAARRRDSGAISSRIAPRT
jgi:hypothetical protein